MGNIKMTADIITAEDKIILNNNEIENIVQSVSSTTATKNVVSEAGIASILADIGWYPFELSADNTTHLLFSSNDNRLRQGMPIRSSADGGDNWRYSIIHSKAVHTYILAGAGVHLRAEGSIVYQIGDLNKVTTERFYVPQLTYSMGVSATEGILYYIGHGSHYINVQPVRYMVEIGAIFKSYSDASGDIKIQPYICYSGVDSWRSVSGSDLLIQSSGAWEQFGGKNVVFSSSNYVLEYLSHFDFSFIVPAGSQGVEQLEIYVTTVTP
jgi:hypothetical protein